MLQIKNITKDYVVNNELTVHALKNVSVDFRHNEFVSILGASGCGKTTFLNIIGGLDHYTDGDLVIDGVSTKQYKDRDWDTYRNHSIGFVFQTYNLIPHQTVLQNVELALTLAGVGKSERRKRAEEALRQVGLGDHIHKRPNQLSGGQMQRVAIARALVNDPDIVLADEPTGALDTETGIQVMEILKKVADTRLVIMVTHNPELAHRYSTRIISILDGEIVGDTAPLSPEEYQSERDIEADKARRKQQEKATKRKKKDRRSTMSFATAFRLSLKNLFTKKGRTLLTSFAGSIGIIGIALILAVSQGMTGYINLIEEQTLATYPLTIESTAMDLSALVSNMMSVGSDKPDRDDGKIYQNSIIYDVVKAVAQSAQSSNDLKAFKSYLESEVANEDSPLHDAIAGLQYNYNLNLSVYTENSAGEIIKSDPGELMRQILPLYLANVEQTTGSYYASLGNFAMDIWQEILPANDGGYINDLLYDQYELVGEQSRWPNSYNEVVLVLNSNNELSDVALYSLGIIGQEYIDQVAEAIRGNTDEGIDRDNNWNYEDFIGYECKVILDSAMYTKNILGVWEDIGDSPDGLRMLYESDAASIPIKVCGIVRPNPDATAHMLTGAIGYTAALTRYVVEKGEQSQAVREQLSEENRDVDIFTGLPFGSQSDSMTDEEKADTLADYYNSRTQQQQIELYAKALCVDNASAIAAQAEVTLNAMASDSQRFRDTVAAMFAQQTGMSADMVKQYLDGMTDDQLKDQVRPYIVEQVRASREMTERSRLTAAQTSDPEALTAELNSLNDRTREQLAAYYDQVMDFSEATLEGNLARLGYVDLDTPTIINIFASTFDAKDVIAQQIELYNNSVDEAQQITYTDYVALMMTAVTRIINAVTYVLVAFVAISLIVSSIMIGVITLISVQERTKEIGILRAIGASKHDVSSMFNAETVIVGFVAGLFGVVFTYLLCIPINLILHAATGIATLNAVLNPLAALILVLISVGLTLISGLIPSRSAAKKDPVTCLRTE